MDENEEQKAPYLTGFLGRVLADVECFRYLFFFVFMLCCVVLFALFVVQLALLPFTTLVLLARNVCRRFYYFRLKWLLYVVAVLIVLTVWPSFLIGYIFEHVFRCG